MQGKAALSSGYQRDKEWMYALVMCLLSLNRKRLKTWNDFNTVSLGCQRIYRVSNNRADFLQQGSVKGVLLASCDFPRRFTVFNNPFSQPVGYDFVALKFQGKVSAAGCHIA